jgi:1-acyl-sn-glycerol-3-phosphate acyltransferase
MVLKLIPTIVLDKIYLLSKNNVSFTLLHQNIMLSSFLGLTRLVLFFTIISFLSLLFYLSSLFWSEEKTARNALSFRDLIIKIINSLLGIRLQIYGKPPIEQGLIVANHRSYFDPIVMLIHRHTFPVGKKEVASWPLIGYLCKISGVIFVDRKNSESRQQTCDAIKVVLDKGQSVINFPEGTTHTLPTTIDFNYGSFAMATKLKSAVLPIAIDYKIKTDAFVDDDTFIPHFIKCFGKRTTEIKMTYLEPIYSQDADYLLKSAKNSIDDELLRFRKDWDVEK